MGGNLDGQCHQRNPSSYLMLPPLVWWMASAYVRREARERKGWLKSSCSPCSFLGPFYQFVESDVTVTTSISKSFNHHAQAFHFSKHGPLWATENRWNSKEIGENGQIIFLNTKFRNTFFFAEIVWWHLRRKERQIHLRLWFLWQRKLKVNVAFPLSQTQPWRNANNR